MAVRSWPRALLAAVAAFAVSGCIDFSSEDPVPFGTLEAPVWEPGFAWTWQSTVEGTYTSTSEDGTHESSGRSRADIAHEVVGTAPLPDGRSGYVLDRTGATYEMLVGGLFSRDSMVLIEPGTLAPLAQADGGSDCVSPEQVSWSMTSRYLESVDRLLEFPLADGHAWEGSGDDDVEWSAEVLGQELVKVPAGSFPAVVVSFTGASEDEGGSDYGSMYPESELSYPRHDEDFTYSMKVWYAEAARNIVRVEFEQRGESTYGDESMSMHMTGVVELATLQLTAKEGATYPAFTGGSRGMSRPAVHIVADKAFPLNAAPGDRNVTFGLAEGASQFDVATVDAVLPYALGDEWEGYTIRWTVQDASYRHTFFVEAVGPTITVSLPPGGHFRVDATLWWGDVIAPRGMMVIEVHDGTAMPAPTSVPMPDYDYDACMPRYVGMRLARANAEVYWEQTFAVNVSAGLPERVPLGVLETPAMPGIALVEYTIESAAPVVQDAAHVVLAAPEGDEVALASGDDADVDEPGEWQVLWDVWGATADPQTIAAGHQATVRLEVRY